MFAKFKSATDHKVEIYVDPTRVAWIESFGDSDACLRVNDANILVKGSTVDATVLLEATLYDRAYENGKAAARAALRTAQGE